MGENIYVIEALDIVNQQVTPTLTWPAPAPITYGTPLSATQLNATANTPGTFVYTPAAGTVLSAGNQTLSVVFTPTDTANYTTATTTVVQTVTPASTSVSLVSSANPQTTGQPVTFMATVNSSAAGTRTGSVVFFAGTTNLGTVSVTGNTASLTTTFAAAGTYSITAQYSGDNNYSGSTSAALDQLITSNSRLTLTLTSSLNPSFIGQAVTFTATYVNGKPPDGETVTFKRGTTVLGTAFIVNGVASFTTSTLPVGNSRVSANYPGDGIFRPKSAALRQRVNLNPTTATLTSNPNPSAYGQIVVLTANVTTPGPVAPTGTVTFRDAGAALGTVAVANEGSATLTRNNLSAGVHSLTVTYNGDSLHAKSTSPAVNQTVDQSSSTTSLISSRNPSRAGQNVTFTASVTTSTGIAATGTVTFSLGATTL